MTATRFDKTANGIDQFGSHTHQRVPRPHDGKRLLHRQASVRDRVKQAGVEPGLASQFLGIHPVTLAMAAANGWQLTGMGDQDFMTILAQVLAHPQGVGACFDRNPSGLDFTELLS